MRSGDLDSREIYVMCMCVRACGYVYVFRPVSVRWDSGPGTNKVGIARRICVWINYYSHGFQTNVIANTCHVRLTDADA